MLKLRLLVIFIAISCVHCKSAKNETKPAKSVSEKSISPKILEKSKRDSDDQMGLYASNTKEEPFRPMIPMHFQRPPFRIIPQRYENVSPQISHVKPAESAIQYADSPPTKNVDGVQYEASSAYRGPFAPNPSPIYDSYQPPNYLAHLKQPQIYAANPSVAQQYTYEQTPQQKQQINYVIAIPEEYMRHLQESLANPSRTPHAFAIPAHVVRIFPLTPSARDNGMSKQQIQPIFYSSPYQQPQYSTDAPVSMAMHYVPTFMNAMYNGQTNGGFLYQQQQQQQPQHFQYQQSYPTNPFYQQPSTSYYVYPSQHSQHQLNQQLSIVHQPRQISVQSPSPSSASSSPVSIVHFKPLSQKTSHQPPSLSQHPNNNNNQFYQSDGATYARLVQRIPFVGQSSSSTGHQTGPTSAPVRVTAQSTIFSQPIYPTVPSSIRHASTLEPLVVQKQPQQQQKHQGPTERVPSAQHPGYHKQSSAQAIPLYNLPSHIQYGTHLQHRPQHLTLTMGGKGLQILPPFDNRPSSPQHQQQQGSSPPQLTLTGTYIPRPNPSSIPAASRGGSGAIVKYP